MRKLEVASVIFLGLYFLALIIPVLQEFFRMIKNFIYFDDGFLFASVPLLILIFSLIMIYFTFKISKESLSLKISYWINILFTWSPFLIYLYQIYICKTKWCVGYEPYIAYGISLIISSIFILISFILFVIGYRKQRTVSKN